MHADIFSGHVARRTDIPQALVRGVASLYLFVFARLAVSLRWHCRRRTDFVITSVLAGRDSRLLPACARTRRCWAGQPGIGQAGLLPLSRPVTVPGLTDVRLHPAIITLSVEADRTLMPVQYQSSA
jgi:hypothetical protein